MNARNELSLPTGSETARLLGALRNPACYPHPVQRVDILETHISWVVLTGAIAYKIKKPVNLGFVDFTSLSARRHYCEEELRLNRRLAPGIYLDTVAITGDPGEPRIDGKGTAIEYAVKMREFPQAALLEAALARGEIGIAAIEALARKIARFHAAAPSATVAPAVDATAAVLAPALDNFRQMLPLLDSPADATTLTAVRDWTQREYRVRAACLARRHAAGRVRECHGDLHLGNIVLIGGEPTPFDCIEFSAALRWTDVISEAAFLMMDLEAHGRRDLAYAFVNAYLEVGGDYDGGAALPFYLAYRAVVRAKISLIRAGQLGAGHDQARSALQAYRRYIALAVSYTQARRGALIITHGVSGSGKTTLTQPAIAALGAIRVRSDLERKRLHGLDPLARSGSAPGAGIYTADATARAYELLAGHAATIAGAGFPVIVDATFLRRGQRSVFRALARRLGVPFAIVSVTTPHEISGARVASRAASGGDASEATTTVLENQIATQEPLTADESSDAIVIDVGEDPAAGARMLIGALVPRLPPQTCPNPTPKP